MGGHMRATGRRRPPRRGRRPPRAPGAALLLVLLGLAGMFGRSSGGRRLVGPGAGAAWAGAWGCGRAPAPRTRPVRGVVWVGGPPVRSPPLPEALPAELTGRNGGTPAGAEGPGPTGRALAASEGLAANASSANPKVVGFRDMGEHEARVGALWRRRVAPLSAYLAATGLCTVAAALVFSGAFSGSLTMLTPPLVFLFIHAQFASMLGLLTLPK